MQWHGNGYGIRCAVNSGTTEKKIFGLLEMKKIHVKPLAVKKEKEYKSEMK